MSSTQPSMVAAPFAKNTQPGFTLIELMVTLAVLAILLGIAVPAFQEITLNSKLRSHSNNIVASALLARSEAIKRNAVVRMCVSADSATCTTGGWEQGWLVYHDADNDNILDAGESILQHEKAASTGFRIQSAADNLIFLPSGVGASQATLKVCRATPSVGAHEREVTISATGRTSIAKTTSATCS